MIAKMDKYYFVVLRKQHEDFLSRLQELGLVDVTTTGWEPAEGDRELMTSIEKHRAAVSTLRRALSEGKWTGGKAFGSGAEAFDKYQAAQSEVSALSAERSRLLKAAEEAAPWGDFDPEKVQKLKNDGIVLRFFSVYDSDFAKKSEQWASEYTVEPINSVDGVTYFAVVASPEQDVAIDAQEYKSLTMTAAQAEAGARKLEDEIEGWDKVFADAAASVDAIERDAEELTDRLNLTRAAECGRSEADGELVVMEAWAETSTAQTVTAMLEEYPDVIYIKEDPTPEDDTPVKLHNNRFASLFELIGSMYALPKYGTVDLTPFFAPFYMLFFAICLNDAGYGAIIFLAGLFLLLKGGASMKRPAKLSMICGGATVLFGLYTGSLFGMSLPELLGYPDTAHSPFLDFQNQFFSIALAIGVIQILLGMFINICMTTRLFGLRYALGTLGWFLLLVSGCLAAALPMLNEAWTIPWFSTSSPAFYAVCCISLVLMLFFNSPGKNLFINFGSGLWNTYNNVTGLLSDVLSYIRLFAIGLSGGVLALVFNRLALGLTGLDAGFADSSVVAIVAKIVGASVILLIGHGINLFMSSISSFVHPMRLTFVEFFKNAGFEMTSRSFEPLKKVKE